MSTAQENFDALMASLEAESADRKRNTLMFPHKASGAFLIYISGNEADPVSSLLGAMVDIKLARGQLAHDQRFRIRRVSDLVVNSNHKVHWSVHDERGGVVAQGYAASEAEASEKIKAFVVSTLLPNG